MMFITENIEMELFSSVESCVEIQTAAAAPEEEQQLEKYTSKQVSLNLRKRDLHRSQSHQMYRSVRMFTCGPVIC